MKKIFLLLTLTILLINLAFAITGSTITSSANNSIDCPPLPISQWCPNCDVEEKGNDCLCPMTTDERGCGTWDCDSCQTLTQAQIQKAIQIKNRLRIGEEGCPNDCTCTGSSTKCQLQNGAREMTIKSGNSGNMIVQVRGVDMSTKVELYQSEGEVYGVFKSNTKIIKVMPDQVKTRLTERVGGLEEHEIELDENGEYQVQARKKARLFGFIPVRERVRFKMNSETGEIIKQRNSWWGFLAKDELIVGNTCATVSPESRGECCQNKGFDSYNQETGKCEIDTSIDEVVE